jgi:hypothetical protein
MKKELSDRLRQRWPLILSGIGQIGCGDGWYDLLDLLCGRLQFDIDHNREPQIVAVQIKEKFGGLSFYVESGNDRQRGMIDFASDIARRTCEQCGSPGWLISDRNGIERTRCLAHAPADAIWAERE